MTARRPLVLLSGDYAELPSADTLTGVGDASGPGSSTDTAFPRFSGTGGKTLQNSAVTCDGSGNLAGVGTINTFAVLYSQIVNLTGSVAITSATLADITGLSLTIPAAGTYMFEFEVSSTLGTSSTLVGYGVNVSAGTLSNQRFMFLHPFSSTAVNGGSLSTNNTVIGTSSRTITGEFPARIFGSFTCTTSGTCQLRAQVASSVSLTFLAGSYGRIQKQ